MLQTLAEDPGSLSPEQLRAAIEAGLRETVDAVGAATVAERAGLDRATVDALAAGESPELTLEEAAAVYAAGEDRPDAESVLLESRDELLMGMSMAVLDVETVESGIDGAIEAKEIQQKIEGRFPMTLGEFALLLSFIEGRKP
jgi:hypothetical protein